MKLYTKLENLMPQQICYLVLIVSTYQFLLFMTFMLVYVISGVMQTYNSVKFKNLPFSLEDVHKMISNCKICAEIKPCFFKPPKTHLIKATQPMECLSIDFKGPFTI